MPYSPPGGRPAPGWRPGVPRGSPIEDSRGEAAVVYSGADLRHSGADRATARTSGAIRNPARGPTSRITLRLTGVEPAEMSEAAGVAQTCSGGRKQLRCGPPAAPPRPRRQKSAPLGGRSRLPAGSRRRRTIRCSRRKFSARVAGDLGPPRETARNGQGSGDSEFFRANGKRRVGARVGRRSGELRSWERRLRPQLLRAVRFFSGSAQ